MKQYGIFEAIFLSFFSRDLYRDVATRWGGKAVFYLFVVLTLSWMIPTYKLQLALTNWYIVESAQLLPQLPVVTIKNGKLSTPENRPYIIANPDSKETIAIIDTSGQYTDIHKTKAIILITDTQMIAQKSSNETRIYQIPTSVDSVIDPQVVNLSIKNYVGYSWIAMFIVSVIGSFFFRLIQVILYSIIGKIFSAITKVRVTFGQITQITMVALTPAIVARALIDGFNLNYASTSLLCFTLAILYMFYGIWSNKNS